LGRRLHQLVQEDTAAYEEFMNAYKIPKQHPDRPMAVSTALHKATEVPLEIAELSCEVGRSIHSALPSAKLAVHSDLTVGITMAIAAAHAALHTVSVNLKFQSNQYLIDAWRPRIKQSEQNLEELKRLC
jgi:glutamate formiminotransferase/glutamate formiminotransferase/formiminotetrahydrofolate cyclodeaminase